MLVSCSCFMCGKWSAVAYDRGIIAADQRCAHCGSPLIGRLYPETDGYRRRSVFAYPEDNRSPSGRAYLTK